VFLANQSVALVQDNAGLRESLVVLLDGNPGFRCTGAFAFGEAAIEGTSGLAADVILMDMPNKSSNGSAG
jgi:DNA-binding NarL/FixJ family response regulator